MMEILDLHHDGVNVAAFCPTSRELFVSHTSTYTKLDQWNIDEKKLVHTYLCSEDDLRWDELAISPDGELLIAATYPRTGAKAKVHFVDTRAQQIRYTTENEYLVRAIAFDHSGKFIWITPTYPGPDPFVYDRDGKKHAKFDSKDYEPKNRERLWVVPASKGGPPEGLFYKDVSGTVHTLVDNPLNEYYAISKDGRYIGTSTWDQRVRIWRTSDLQEVFNQKVGAHPVVLLYDSKKDQFLILDGMDGDTCLHAIKLPQRNAEHQLIDPANNAPHRR
jgi:WD40 repeat protein